MEKDEILVFSRWDSRSMSEAVSETKEDDDGCNDVFSKKVKETIEIEQMFCC